MEEMNELYYRDSYLRKFESVVIRTQNKDGHSFVVLEDTLFYPEGGGQPCDLGTLNGMRVVDVQRKDGFVVHEVDGVLEESVHVIGKIDWQRRFDLMQNHTGEHIVSGLVHALHGYDNVGFHMGDMIQVDLSGYLDSKQLQEIERKANEVVYANLEVKELFPAQEDLSSMEYRSKKELAGKVRIIAIDNVDMCACCGLHVKRTGEIGMIRIISSLRHKGGVRFYMLSGRKALLYSQAIHAQNHLNSVSLCAREEETNAALERLKEETLVKERDLVALAARYVEMKAAQYEDGQKIIIDFEEGIDRAAMRRMANLLVDKGTKVACVLCGSDNDYAYVIASKEVDLKAFAKGLNIALSGKGGGSGAMIQGSYCSGKEMIRRVVTDVFVENNI